MIDESFITSYITSTFEDVKSTVNLGYTFFFYRDDNMHAFATIASTGNEYDFTALDVILPHPDYSRNISYACFRQAKRLLKRIRPMLTEAYDIAMKRYNRRKAH